jgi:hypothetical protein
MASWTTCVSLTSFKHSGGVLNSYKCLWPLIYKDFHYKETANALELEFILRNDLL